ncbi:NAD-dependent protein deacylase [Iodidimonas nitroreducens]|uniref:NAD-dependent protein deacylase n=1 Tax=Iodidimonas nitroreducens TaxID=1236968 RepID=A0A5A7NBM5_9PROT|nr:NAD-dependent deacylase [Iodidimonas nitroreducens]GER04449.1 NAD-dependent protein deacylase [Iodidimonas nitroreducens]
MPRHVVVLTGAGISAESGLGTFRDAGGLWANHRIEDVATPEGFIKNPQLVHYFYNQRRAELQRVAPNAAHHALVDLEAELEVGMGGGLTLITQNVDDLHERAGSRSVLHMHGELLKARCEACAAVFPWHRDLGSEDVCIACGHSSLRPRIVWFGEVPFHLDAIDAAMARADLFISIGTSGSVYPAAGLVRLARTLGVRTVELNLEPSENHDFFDESHQGPAATIVPAFIADLLARYKKARGA